MIKNIFPFILFFSFVSPISWTSNGEMFSQFKTLENLSSQSSKILTDFQGKDRLDTQRNESSPRNRINNLKINDGKSLSEINKKALLLPKSSRAFLVPRLEKALNISHESYPNSGHLKVDKVIKLSSLPAITQQMHLYKWEKWRTR